MFSYSEMWMKDTKTIVNWVPLSYQNCDIYGLFVFVLKVLRNLRRI